MNSLTIAELDYFEEQVNLHHKSVLAYALSLNIDRHSAEDLVQEGFLTALHKLAKIDRDRNFGAYVRGIVRFKYLERGRKLKEFCLGDEIIDIIDQQFTNWHIGEVNRQEVFSALEHCMKKLTDEQQQIIKMFYTDKSSCNTIATTLQITAVTVRKRLERIRNDLKACINLQQEVTNE